jgi:hypothetical protein
MTAIFDGFATLPEPLPPPMVKRDNRAADYFSLSQTLRRISHEYRRWASEDEINGRLERYRQYQKSADAAWDNAKWYLGRARLERNTDVSDQ